MVDYSLDNIPLPPWLQNAQDAATAAGAAPTPPASPSSVADQYSLDNLPPAPWHTEAQAGMSGPPSAPVYVGPGNAERTIYINSAPKEAPKGPTQEPSFLSNLGTTAVRAVEGVGRLPRTLADLYTGISGDKSGLAGVIQQNVPTADEGTRNAFADLSALTGADLKPYQPQTLPGQIFQDFGANALPAAVGPGGILGLISREAANLGSTAGQDVTAKLYPNSPGLQVGASLLGGLAGGAVPPILGAVGSGVSNLGGRLFNTTNAGERSAARQLVDAASNDKQGLIDAIDKSAPQWTFPDSYMQPRPTLGAATQDSGIQNLTYNDMGSNAEPYRINRLLTNQAQREAVAKMTPDIAPQVDAATQHVSNLTGNLPSGVSAQEAGSTFRQGLQNVYDQRVNARSGLGSGFDVLDTSPAQINLRPVMDYATEQAAQNAGEVGKAYSAALGQFKSGTGITLDTAPFANSALKGLNDLADSYPQGSSAQRAVLDVKSRAEQLISDAEPAVGDARNAWAQASRPLDVFDQQRYPGPIPNAIAQTRFGGYVSPNESVVSSFLRSQGGPDAIDALNGVFGDVKTATQPLQDYIASQVKANAVNPDGTVNLAKLQATVKPYSAVLNKMPFNGLKSQFSTIEGAQTAVDQLTKRQNLYETFANGLNSTMERDLADNAVYSPKMFDKFVTANKGELVSAYGQDGADRLNQINGQLTDMAQTPFMKNPGQSGTPQALQSGGNVLQHLLAYESGGEAAGDILASVTSNVGSAFGLAGSGKLLGLGIQNRLSKFNDTVQAITRQALLDPQFAKSLLVKYNANLPSVAGGKAMNYVQGHLAALQNAFNQGGSISAFYPFNRQSVSPGRFPASSGLTPLTDAASTYGSNVARGFAASQLSRPDQNQ